MRGYRWVILAGVLGLVFVLVSGLSGIGTGLPELHLQKLVLDPPSPVVRGETVRVRAWVMNTGDRPAGEFRVEFFYRPLDGGERWISFHIVTLPNLPPSAQEAVEVKDDGQPILFPTGELELGIYEIRVVADSNDQIPEEDETNNELSTTLTVLASKLGMPDLQPLSLDYSPRAPVSGKDVVNVSSTIINSGDRAAGPFQVSFRVDDQEFYTVQVEGLEPGERTTVQGPLDPYSLGLRPGGHRLAIVVDPLDQIEEQDEANNTISTMITIQGAELQPISLEFDKPLIRLDERVAVTSEVSNSGKGAAEDIKVGFYIDGTQFATARIDSLGPGESAVVKGELDPMRPELGLTPGEHQITVFVDPENRIPELDEANNQLMKAITLLPPEPKLAELHPESLELNPPSPVELIRTEKVMLASSIRNTGKATAKGFSVRFSYRARGTLRWIELACTDCEDLSLAPGAELRVTGEFSILGLAPGLYELRVVVDPEDAVEELDEANNELQTTLTLLAPRLPDLSLDPALPIEVAPGYQVKHGQTLRFTAHLRNLGELDAGPFAVEFKYCRIPPVPLGGGQPQPGQAQAQACTQESDFVTFALQPVDGLAVGGSTTVTALLETLPLQPGNYLIRVVIDPPKPGQPKGEVIELSELNNQADLSVLVQGADLIPIELRFAPQPPVTQGEEVWLTATVLNQGVEPAGKFDVSFAWCKLVDEESCTKAADFVVFAQVAFPGIAVNNPEPAMVKWDTSKLEPGGGTYLIRVVVDPPTAEHPEGQVQEQDETNNVLISTPIVIIAKPDLRVVLLQLQPAHELVQGAALTAIAHIRNEGFADAPEFKVGFFYRAAGEEIWTPFAQVKLDGLALGGETSATAILETAALKPGEYEVRVVLDPEGALAELTKENNTAVAQFTLAPQPPDLTIQPPLRFEPGPKITENGPVKVYADVLNQGGQAAGKFRVAFSYRRIEPLEGGYVEFDSAIIDKLEPGKTATALGVLDTSKLPGGTYEICVEVDVDDEVAESDEKNNRYCTPPPFVVIPPPADLTVQPPLRFEPQPPVDYGQTLKVYADVLNQGGRGSGRFRVAFFIDGQEFDSTVLESIPPGESATAVGILDTTMLRDELHEICVVVDPDDTVEESDEGNNRYCERVIVIPPPADLTVQPPLRFEPQPPVDYGQTLKVYADVLNQGGRPSGRFQVSFRVDGREFDRAILESIPPGEKATALGVLDTTTLQGGVHEICVVVDPDNLVEEGDEENNSHCETIFVIPPPPDLMMLPTLEFKPEPPFTVGQQVEVHAWVRNVGGRAVDRFQVGFFYHLVGSKEGPTRFATITVRDLPPGADHEVIANLNTTELTPGTYEICVVADPDDLLAEANEENNSYCTPPPFIVISGGEVDLYPVSLAILPSTIVQAGQTVTVELEVGNRGKDPAGPFVVRFLYVRKHRTDWKEFGSVRVEGLAPGETATLRAKLDTHGLGYGDYYIKAVIDADDQVAETNEENNEIQRIITLI